MSVRKVRTSAGVVVAVAALALASAGGAAQANATDAGATAAASGADATTLLPSNLPPWAASAKVLGATNPNDTVYLDFELKGRDLAGEKALGTAVSTPGNPLYRHYLTKAQFEQAYAPAADLASGLSSLLTGLGMTNVSTDKLGLSVSAQLPASLAATLFDVTFHQVEHGGVSARVPTSEPTLPAALAPFIAAYTGIAQEPLHLDNVVAGKVSSVPETITTKAATDTCAAALPATGAPTGYFNADPSSTSYASTIATDKPKYAYSSGEAQPNDGSTTSYKPYIVKGYQPAQIRGAYDVDKVAQTGAGVKAGVVLFYDGPDVGCDLATFSKNYGLAAPNYIDLGVANEATTIVGGNAPILAPADAAGEQTLDVEAIHQMAPDATIYYSGAAAPEDAAIFPAITTLVATGVDVINNSYGGTGDTSGANITEFADLVTTPAMTMGTGIDFSSGDGADDVAADGVREADFPATSDSVTAVGGTGIEIGAQNNYQGEFYWGTYSTPALAAGATTWGRLASQAGGAGGGGGVSTAYAEPAYQKLLKPNGQPVVPAEETTNTDTATSGIGSPGTPGRVVPDVAMIADSTTGILVGETQTPDATSTTQTVANQTAVYSTYRIGGTSVSSPIFTGMMALADQALGTSVGFANPTLYAITAAKGGDGAFRDPQIGRSPTGSRYGSTAAQVLTAVAASPGVTGDVSGTYSGTGPGVVPVVTEVRPDYTDTANPGLVTATSTEGVATSFKTGNAVIYHLRGQGILGTLEDLPGYDDSTGLGSPDAPQFIADIAGTSVTTPPASLPEAPAPVLFLVFGLAIGGAVLVRRRRNAVI